MFNLIKIFRTRTKPVLSDSLMLADVENITNSLKSGVTKVQRSVLLAKMNYPKREEFQMSSTCHENMDLCIEWHIQKYKNNSSTKTSLTSLMGTGMFKKWVY